jgi:hypothetical protein
MKKKKTKKKKKKKKKKKSDVTDHFSIVKMVQQCRYRPGVAQRVPGS